MRFRLKHTKFSLSSKRDPAFYLTSKTRITRFLPIYSISFLMNRAYFAKKRIVYYTNRRANIVRLPIFRPKCGKKSIFPLSCSALPLWKRPKQERLINQHIQRTLPHARSQLISIGKRQMAFLHLDTNDKYLYLATNAVSVLHF